MLLLVDVTTYAAAAEQLEYDVGAEIVGAARRLGDALAATGGMAGTDPAGATWARAYDAASADAVRALEDLADAATVLAGLVGACADNHRRAESASVPGGGAGVPGVPASGRAGPGSAAVFVPPPSAWGGPDVAGPAGWGVLRGLEQRVWPNGQQDRLRAAAQAWLALVPALWTADSLLQSVVEALARQVSPEVPDAIAACQRLADGLARCCREAGELSSACADYADRLDAVHHEVIGQLVGLGEQTLGIQVLGGLFSLVTGPGAEVVTQLVETERIAAVSAAVCRCLDALVAWSDAAAAAVMQVGGRLGDVSGDLAQLLARRPLVAGLDEVGSLPLLSGPATAQRAAEAAGSADAGVADLPALILRDGQVERKFKHAAALGVDLPRGRAGFDAFARRIREFLDDPATIRVHGEYRGRPVVLSYQTGTRRVIVQAPDGEFVSAWHGSAKQLMHIVRDRRLGGD